MYNQEENNQIDARHYHEPVNPHEYHVSSIVLVLLLCIALILAIIGIIVDYKDIATASTIFVIMLAVLVIIALPVTVVYSIIHRAYLDRIKRNHARLDLQAKEEQVRRENEAHLMRMYLAESRLMPDNLGNRPYIFDRASGRIIEASSGNYLQPVPSTYSPHFEYNNTANNTLAEGQAQNLLPSGIKPPTMEYIIEQLGYNQLQVCLGVSLETGNPFTIDLIEGTHYRIMGASGFGKSCQAASIIEQVTQTNDSDHLLLASLDLEHKTSRLFENLPHIAQLQIGRRSIDCVATNPDEVATHLGYLRQELDRRKMLSDYDLRLERFMLIYVEEFLSLRREVEPVLLKKMLDDFTILALRGRKYGLYLLACAQVDYSQVNLRDAMGQFNVNMSFSVKPKAAQAAGFMSYDLLKQNFAAKQKGQFVLETTGCNDIMLAPEYDVKAKLLQLDKGSDRGSGMVQNGSSMVQSRFNNGSRRFNADILNLAEPSSELGSDGSETLETQAKIREMKQLYLHGWNKKDTICKVYQCTKGGSKAWIEGERIFDTYIRMVESEEA